MEAKQFPEMGGLVQEWLEYGGHILRQRGQVHLALSAHPATLGFLRQWSLAEWPWSATHLYLAEESWVPRHYPTSHYRQVHEACHPHRVQLHGWETETIDPALSAARFEKMLIRQLGNPPRLDLALLEAAPDGAVAALEPGSPAALAEEQFAIDQGSPSRNRRQLSLTRATLRRAREFWLIEGAVPHGPHPAATLPDDCPPHRTFRPGG